MIFVKKAPRKLSNQRKKNLNGQITVLSIFRLFYFFQRTNFPQRTYFSNVFWQNSRQEHNLKLTPQRFCITRHIHGVVAFGAIPIWWFSGHLTHSNLNPGFRSFDRWDFYWAGFGPRESLGRPKVTSSGSIFSNQNGIWAILTVLGSGIANPLPAFPRHISI